MFFAVILAPYGLQGSLTGHVYKESDPNTQKILEDWKHYYVVPDPETWECDQSAVPKMVEVVVGKNQVATTKVDNLVNFIFAM